MAKIKIPNQIIPDSVHHIEEEYTEEYKKLVEEANEKIEADRRRELKAWKDAKNGHLRQKNRQTALYGRYNRAFHSFPGTVRRR